MAGTKRIYRIETTCGLGGLYSDFTEDLLFSAVGFYRKRKIDEQTGYLVDDIGYEMHRLDSYSIAEMVALHHLPGVGADYFNDSDPARPTAKNDGLRMGRNRLREGGWHFGFESFDSMSQWLDGATPHDVLSVGGSIVILEAKDWRAGKKQVIFRPESVVSQIRLVDPYLYRETKRMVKWT